MTLTAPCTVTNVAVPAAIVQLNCVVDHDPPTMWQKHENIITGEPQHGSRTDGRAPCVEGEGLGIGAARSDGQGLGGVEESQGSGRTVP